MDPVAAVVVNPPSAAAAPAPNGAAAPLTPAPAPRQTTAATEADKPGYLTTEFWISALALVGFILAALFHWSDSQVSNWTQGIHQFAPLVALVVGYLVTNQYCTKRIELKKALAGKLTLNDLKGLLPHGASMLPTAAGAAADAVGGATGVFNAGGVMVRVQNGRIVEISLPQTGYR